VTQVDTNIVLFLGAFHLVTNRHKHHSIFQ